MDTTPTWFPISGPGGPGPRDALHMCGYEVARIDRRLDGTWRALLRYPGREVVVRACTDYDTGRAGIEAWTNRHHAALTADTHRRNLEWVAKQTWRGASATAAREELARLR